MRLLTIWPMICVCAALAGCGGLPGGGPSTASFEAAEHRTPEEAQDGFILVDLTPSVLDLLAGRNSQSFSAQFGDHSQVADSRVGRGDTIEVTIWEASSGGLFSVASDQASAGSRSVTIPAQVVDQSGEVTVPYAGRIKVAGLTLAQVEEKVVAALEDKAIQPQAVATLKTNRSNAVTVSGEGIGGRRVPLSQGGERLLDVLAEAGGPTLPAHEALLTLERSGRSVSVPMIRVVRDPAENILMRRGDTVTIVRDAQSFTALGATGANTIVDFEEPTLTLDKAVARSGGLMQATADPAGVFLLRREPVAIARKLDPDFPIGTGARAVNVVYRANLRDPNSLFLAHRFEILPDDILYVSGAPANDVEKFLRLVGLGLGTARTSVTTASAF